MAFVELVHGAGQSSFINVDAIEAIDPAPGNPPQSTVALVSGRMVAIQQPVEDVLRAIDQARGGVAFPRIVEATRDAGTVY